MRDLLHTLRSAIDQGRPVAYCRLVETRGSTPQKAGAAMLVYGDGSQAGTLGGGCVEAEVKRKALDALHTGQATVERFQLDSDYGWDDGLICGGRMMVLIDPLATADARHYIDVLTSVIDSRRGAIEAIAFDGQASGMPAVASYVFDHSGTVAASARAPHETAQKLVDSLPKLSARPAPSAAHGIAFLPHLPRCLLLIVGGGHVGQAVARLATDLDFDVTVVDDRPEYVTPERFPTAEQRMHGDFKETLRGIEVTPSTYCLIVTRGHNHDEEALFHLIDRGARYVGMIGSRRKIKLIFDDLLNEGVSPELLEQVYAPVGLDIGSQTVAEIAVSIAAQLVAHRNLGDAPPHDGALRGMLSGSPSSS
jgi:xanthine dehydrogenase accessory factor